MILSNKAKMQVPDWAYLNTQEKYKLNRLVEKEIIARQKYTEYKKKQEAKILKLQQASNELFRQINEIRKECKLRKEQECEHKNASFWQCYRDDCSYPRGIHSECKDCGSNELVRNLVKDVWGKSIMTNDEYERAKPIGQATPN